MLSQTNMFPRKQIHKQQQRICRKWSFLRGPCRGYRARMNEPSQSVLAIWQQYEHRSWIISNVESCYQATTREDYKRLRLSMCCSDL
jgi:hypothetical protein